VSATRSRVLCARTCSRTPCSGSQKTACSPVRHAAPDPSSYADASRRGPDFHRRASRDDVGGVIVHAARARAERGRAGVLCAELRTLPPRRARRQKTARCGPARRAGRAPLPDAVLRESVGAHASVQNAGGCATEDVAIALVRPLSIEAA
jgi:hypothetical protein